MLTDHARFHALSLGAAVAGVGAFFMLVSGVEIASVVRLVGVLVAQGVAGGYWWSRARGPWVSAAELVGMGVAIGSVASVVSGLLVLTLMGSSIGWALPLLAALVHWMVWGRRDSMSFGRVPVVAASVDRGLVGGVIVALSLGTLSLIPNVRSYPLTWLGEWSGYHGDMLFFESIATSMARLGPLDSIFSPDAVIRYHWLTYAWAGQVAEAAGTAPFVVLTRALPFVAVVASCLIAVSWARRLTAVSWAPVFSVVLLITGGYVGATYGAIFNFDSPSQSLTTLWLLAFSVALLASLRPGGVHVTALSVLALLSFGIAGGKISAGAVGVGAMLWIALIGIMRRTEWRKHALMAAGAVLFFFALGYVLVVMGSADPGGLKLLSVLDRASSIQGMNPIPGVLGIALGTLLLVVAISARWSGLLWFVYRPESRWTPDTVLGTGFALAGIATVIFLSGGMNDTWFALAASAPLSVISAAGVSVAWESLGTRRRTALAAAIGAALVLVLLVWLLWLSGPSGGSVWVSSLRWLGPVIGVGGAVFVGFLIGFGFGGKRAQAGIAGSILLVALVAAPGRALGVGSGQMGVQPGLGEESFTPIQEFIDGIDAGFVRSWTDGHVAAATFLKTNASSGDVVATNVTYSPLVPALTGLQTYVSGMAYQAPYGLPQDLQMLLNRERETWNFIDAPTVDSARPLCSAEVAWAWIDPQRTVKRDWSPFASIVFENSSALILRMDEQACF